MLPDVIVHSVNNVSIGQRADDGFINATTMCQAAGKRMGNYLQNLETTEFVAALSRSTGIPADRLVQPITSGSNEQRGTWVHLQVAIHCAMWCSADFAVQVTTWIEGWYHIGHRPLKV
jgi:KilA-N domain